MKAKEIETEKELLSLVAKGLKSRATKVYYLGKRQVKILNKPLTSAQRMKKHRAK